jgi:hypothetical protein
MSLQTDIIFAKALKSNADLMAELPAGNVYNTAIALPDEEADNAPVPYIIVSFNGLNNQDTTKDSSYQGMTDTVTIGITIAARTRVELADLAITARQTIEEYLQAQSPGDEDYELVPNVITLQAQGVQYDSLKPCYWQELIYTCETNPD